MGRFLFLLIALLTGTPLLAQEFNVQVSVNTPQLQTVDPKVFQSLESDLKDFLSSQKWTEDEFEPEERIELSVQLTIKNEISPTSFDGELSIQATRPVYGSDYKTVTINHRDRDISIFYEQFQPIEFSKTGFNDNLSSLFSYYIYMVLGFDYDTFSPLGGEDFFQAAQTVINAIPASELEARKGWRGLDGKRNRYWMMENMLNPGLKPVRKALYDYHRQGLDLLESDPVTARAVILTALDEMQLANKRYPRTMIIQMFVNSKADELIKIFKDATSIEKTKVKKALKAFDPSKASRDERQIGS